MYIKNKLKYEASIKIENIILLVLPWIKLLKLFVGKNPPDDIKVKAKLNASKVLKSIIFNVINDINVKEE